MMSGFLGSYMVSFECIIIRVDVAPVNGCIDESSQMLHVFGYGVWLETMLVKVLLKFVNVSCVYVFEGGAGFELL